MSYCIGQKEDLMFTHKETFKQAFIKKLASQQGKGLEEASTSDLYASLAGIVRDEISKNWVITNRQYAEKNVKQVYYFSIEFLLGKALVSNLINLGIKDFCGKALSELGVDIEVLAQYEPDAGLGSGGLGRLAACFLDSMASEQLPGHGCGIRYKYGQFQQKIVNGQQVELPDPWLKEGNIWEFRKPDKSVVVKFGGNVRTDLVEGKLVFIHENYDTILAVPYDIPIVGYKNITVNTLRLWSAEAAMSGFDYSSFNRGDYLKAIEYKYSVEAISEILYPDDSHYQGRVLRLKQQYFFVSAGLQSIIRRFKKKKGILSEFADKIAIHINDTHPALAIPELMRILIDEEGLGWDEAWTITQNTISYTNHTIMPEALEKWPIETFKIVLPRIFMIVEEINERFCQHLWQRYPGDWGRIKEMAVIADGFVHMANLAIVGSYSVNGVAKVHTEILKKQVMRNFYQYFPHKFNNKTNGITHRRWLVQANPLLAKLITNTIGSGWIYHPNDLAYLEAYAQDSVFQEELHRIKYHNKLVLAKYVKEKYNLELDLQSIFDVQVKRLHAYKRQTLNVFHIMELYNRLKENPDLDMVPRTFIFAGKAAPGYFQAKNTIKLINSLAELINNDRLIHDKLKVIFLENYSVSLAQMIIPAADVSEQISTATKEASGTGNMKFMMNGAPTVGTFDGANIEIRDEVGPDNFFLFGLMPEQVLSYQTGGYDAWKVYNSDLRLRTILEQLINGFFPIGKDEFRSIYENIFQSNDEFFVLKDFAAYVQIQQMVDSAFRSPSRWREICTHNIARSGRFSSDRTIMEYAIGIWKIRSVNI